MCHAARNNSYICKFHDKENPYTNLIIKEILIQIPQKKNSRPSQTLFIPNANRDATFDQKFSLRTKMVQNTNDIGDVKSEINGVEISIRKLEDSNKSLNNSILYINSTLYDLNAKIDNLNESVQVRNNNR